jgi:1-aminocyclopropane-1-carboxylate deaminase/D-cysteine desulfhydrase-like pyridoxal-dependent ACC family enzyme
LKISDNLGHYQILHGWHFGGYAKHSPQLIEFMQQTWQSFNLPTDIVYTSKTFYAVRQMVMDKLIDAGSRVLMVHSGGLQGNASLPNGVLSF